MKCPICHKNLAPACEILGEPTVLTIHRAAHITEALHRLIVKVKARPEMKEELELLERALDL